jgi:hypothetical protein
MKNTASVQSKRRDSVLITGKNREYLNFPSYPLS